MSLPLTGKLCSVQFRPPHIWRLIIESSYVLDGIERGYETTTVRANDTEIFIILMAFMPMFLEIKNTFELTLDSGVGKSREQFNVKKMCQKLNLTDCRGLLFFHAFTGCDYTPSFYGIGKTRWWDISI